MSPLIPLLPHKLVTNVQVAVEVEACGFVVEVGAGLAFVEQLQRFLRRNVQALGQLYGDGPNAVAHDDFLNNRGFNGIFRLILFHRKSGIC